MNAELVRHIQDLVALAELDEEAQIPGTDLYVTLLLVKDALRQGGLRAFLPAGFPKVVTLCGSTRFMDAYTKAQKDETLKGNVVISVGLFGHQEGLDMGGETKRKLDELHLRKIDLADEILVVNPVVHLCGQCGKPTRKYRTDLCEDCGVHVPILMGTYIGSSTRNEIAYAERTGKPVRYLTPSDQAG